MTLRLPPLCRLFAAKRQLGRGDGRSGGVCNSRLSISGLPLEDILGEPPDCADDGQQQRQRGNRDEGTEDLCLLAHWQSRSSGWSAYADAGNIWVGWKLSPVEAANAHNGPIVVLDRPVTVESDIEVVNAVWDRNISPHFACKIDNL